MSPRYYLISAIVVFVLTAVISAATQKRTAKEIFMVLCWVVSGLFLIVGALVGIVQALAMLGIAESGYFF
ncbi:MAG: hypothetical protein HY580_07255 [Nitrospinae bacterium]|nr:hypothetical protein [Nitrospinota bacterium]